MANNQKIKIGIFDSGLGGLTVLKSLSLLYRSNVSFIYLGDLAHLPYGDKSPESIIKYSQQIINFFINQNVDLIVVACNSASSVALKYLQSNYTIPVIGTIEPSINEAINYLSGDTIGIIGTETTITSKAYNKAFSKYPDYKIHSIACPLFVPIVEEGWENTDIAYQIAVKYLSEFKNIKLDIIILACTHYPMLLNTLKSVFSKLGHKNLYFIDSGKAIANHINHPLLSIDIIKPDNLITQFDQFYVTDTPHQFNKLANKFLGTPIPSIKLISL